MPFQLADDQKILALAVAGLPEAQAPSVDVLLTQSAAVDLNGKTQYRPYYVAAKLIEQSPKYQQLKSAEGGVAFTGMIRAIISHYRTQQSLDRRYAWAVPLGFEITDEFLAILEGRPTGANNTTGKGLPIFSTTQLVRQVNHW
jgi:hypothetical protein